MLNIHYNDWSSDCLSSSEQSPIKSLQSTRETYSSNGLSQFYNDPRFENLKGQGITIAVLDDGIDLNHPGFGQDINHDGVSDSILRSNLDFTLENDNTVGNGGIHGTAVAGVITSIAPNINILPLQVLKASGVGITSDVDDALEWVQNNKETYNILGVNLSFSDATNSTRNTNPPFSNEYQDTRNAGISLVAAGGNYYEFYNHRQGFGEPAAYSSTIGTMALASNGIQDINSLASFSQRRLDGLAAPGKGIATFRKNNSNASWSGTSFSTPFVTGAIALLQSVANEYLDRYLSPNEMQSILFSSADVISGGYHSLNVYNAAVRIYDMSDHPPSHDSLFSNYATNQNPSSESDYSFENSILSLSGRNIGTKVDISNLDIESDSILNFSYKSSTPNSHRSLSGIGFDNNASFNPWRGEKYFSLHGHSARDGISSEYRYVGSNTWQEFSIPFSELSNNSTYLTFFAQNFSSQFKNVTIDNQSVF
jgi:subtilisin family serine protease